MVNRFWTAGIFAIGTALLLSAPTVAASASVAPSTDDTTQSGALEYPESWTVRGDTATGTTPSGITVTVRASGKISFSNTTDFSNEADYPSGLSAAALRYNIPGSCTSDCGSLTFEFSEPVQDADLEMNGMGAYDKDALFGTILFFKSSPITLSAGTFADVRDNGLLRIANGGRTVALASNDHKGKKADDGTGCAKYAGCGTLDIDHPNDTVESFTIDHGHAGTTMIGVDAMVYTVGVLPVPKVESLSLVKRANAVDVNGDGAIGSGDQIAYSFDLTNTGNQPLSSLSVTDPMVSGLRCPSGPLDPGESVTCTASNYTITVADTVNGSVHNTATAGGTSTSSGNDVVSNDSETTTPVEALGGSLLVSAAITALAVISVLFVRRTRARA